MAFKFQAIRTREERAQVNRFGLQSPFTSGPAGVREWVVDERRGIYFINLGGGLDRPYFLVLANRERVMLQAEGRRRAAGDIAVGYDECWEIERLGIADAFAGREREIVGWLREALEAYGSLGDGRRTKSVMVRITAPGFV